MALPTNQDSPCQEILRHYFPAAIAFFFLRCIARSTGKSRLSFWTKSFSSLPPILKLLTILKLLNGMQKRGIQRRMPIACHTSPGATMWQLPNSLRDRLSPLSLTQLGARVVAFLNFSTVAELEVWLDRLE